MYNIRSEVNVTPNCEQIDLPSRVFAGAQANDLFAILRTPKASAVKSSKPYVLFTK